jgi:hypothetical protein
MEPRGRTFTPSFASEIRVALRAVRAPLRCSSQTVSPTGWRGIALKQSSVGWPVGRSLFRHSLKR